MMVKLQGKKAIVTGANRSIGRAIAIMFAKEGADVVISYRSDEEGAQKTVESIRKHDRFGEAFYADFTEAQHIDLFYKKALDALGHVDILVNNAGAYDTTSFLDLKTDIVEILLKMAVSVPTALSQLVAKQMKQQKIAGHIINISSVSGSQPSPNRAAHCAAKAAMNMLTKCMAIELAQHNIRVNAIAPGNTSYEVSTPSDQLSLQRIGTPQDQADLALYLASTDSSWITGQIITCDGGQSL